MRWRRVRCPSCKGVVNDPASPSHDRGHANPQPDAQHATGLCRAGCPVCSPFPPLTRVPRTGGDPQLSAVPGSRQNLVHDKRLAARSLIVATAALRFFYTVTLKRSWRVEDVIPTSRQARKLPVVLSQDAVARFLDAVGNFKHRMILTVCYATGLRISEAVRLTPAA